MSPRSARLLLGAAVLAAIVGLGAWRVLGVDRDVTEQRPMCERLVARLCSDLTATDGACQLARDKLRGATDTTCQGLEAHYEQAASELRDLTTGLAELRAPEQRAPHGLAPQLGPPAAELTFVLFCDFQSADCGRASPMASLLDHLYPGRVRFVFRQAPALNARLAAEASLAAHAQGRFWPYHDVLFANPHDLTRGALERYAAQVGLDLALFRQALDTHRFAADVDYDTDLARRAQVRARPTLFLNGRRVEVPYGMTELRELVDSEQHEHRD